MPKPKKPTTPSVETPAWALVAVAAALNPKGLSNDPGRAIRWAARLIARVPEYLSIHLLEMPDEEAVDIGIEEVERLQKEAETWGFERPLFPEGYFTRPRFPQTEPPSFPEWLKLNPGADSFERAVKGWGKKIRHKTTKGLVKFLRLNGYPEQYLRHRIVTKAGYEHALKKDNDRKALMKKGMRKASNKKSEIVKDRIPPPKDAKRAPSAKKPHTKDV
jgi:hypothetical protein